MRRSMTWIGVLVALGMWVGGAQAKSSHKPHHKRVKLRAANRPEMPPGWSWPPSKSLREEGKRCLAHLDELGVGWKKGPEKKKVATPIILTDMTLGGIKFVHLQGGPAFMDCHLAETMAGPGALALKQAGVAEVHYTSTYQYRRVHGVRVLSRHALGLAMDVRSFVTTDGVEHVVERDYKHGDEQLLGIEDQVNLTGAYRMLLTPGNDPGPHDDHFHFEALTPKDKVATPPRRVRPSNT